MSWFYALVRAKRPTPPAVIAPPATFGTNVEPELHLLMEWEETMLRVEARRYAAAVKPIGRSVETRQEFATALHDAARPLVRIVRRRNARTVQRVDEIVSEALAREGIDPEGKLGKFARERVRWMLRMNYGDAANRMKAA